MKLKKLLLSVLFLATISPVFADGWSDGFTEGVSAKAIVDACIRFKNCATRAPEDRYNFAQYSVISKPRRYDVLKELLKRADETKVVFDEDLFRIGTYMTEMMTAINLGALDSVQYLLKEYPQVNLLKEGGRLHRYARDGRTEEWDCLQFAMNPKVKTADRQAILDIIVQEYAKQKKDPQKVAQAREYNIKYRALAHDNLAQREAEKDAKEKLLERSLGLAMENPKKFLNDKYFKKWLGTNADLVFFGDRI